MGATKHITKLILLSSLTILNMTILLLILLSVLLLIFFLIFSNKESSEKEGFADVMGALYPYKNFYYNCLSNCEREDTSKRLGNNNWSCGLYCNSVLTDLRKKLVSSENDNCDEIVPVRDLFDDCQELCGSDRKCNDKCFCLKEIDSRCKQECAYSYLSKGECQKLCIASYKPNCNNLAWNYKRT